MKNCESLQGDYHRLNVHIYNPTQVLVLNVSETEVQLVAELGETLFVINNRRGNIKRLSCVGGIRWTQETWMKLLRNESLVVDEAK